MTSSNKCLQRYYISYRSIAKRKDTKYLFVLYIFIRFSSLGGPLSSIPATNKKVRRTPAVKKQLWPVVTTACLAKFFFPAHDSYLSCANKVDILSNDLTNKMKSVLLKRFRFSRIATKNVKRIFSTCSFLRNFGHRHNFFPLSLSPSLHNPMCTFIIHCFRIVCQMFSFILLLF